MKKDLLKISFGIIAGLCLALLFRCEPKCPKINSTSSTVTTTSKTSKRDVDTVYIWKKEYVEVPKYYKAELKKDSTSTYYFDVQGKNYKGIVTADSKCEVKNLTTNLEVKGEQITITDSIIITNNTVTTITNTIEAKRRMNLLLGSNAMFTTSSMNGVNFNIALKTRKDFIVEAGYNFNFNTPNSYEVGVKIPLFKGKK